MTNAEARFNKSLRPRKPEGSCYSTKRAACLYTPAILPMFFCVMGVPDERGILSCGPEECFACPFFDRGQANLKIESGPNFTTDYQV